MIGFRVKQFEKFRFVPALLVFVFLRFILHDSLWSESKENKASKTHGNSIQYVEKTFNLAPSEKEYVDSTVMFKRFPSCLIIGAKKCGTRALLEYLKLHPRISACNTEQHFFGNDFNYARGLEYYRQQMPSSYPNQVTIEKSPSYFNFEKATRRIYDFNKTIKILVTLRHPVKRMLSDYQHGIREGLSSTKTMEELAINSTTGNVNEGYQPVNVSMYFVHMKRWLEYFPREQIHVVDGDNLVVNPVEELEKVETFLGLDHVITKEKVYFDSNKGFYCMVKSQNHIHCLSDEKGHLQQPIDAHSYSKLMEFFYNYNQQLFTLLGQRFNWD